MRIEYPLHPSWDGTTHHHYISVTLGRLRNAADGGGVVRSSRGVAVGGRPRSGGLESDVRIRNGHGYNNDDPKETSMDWLSRKSGARTRAAGKHHKLYGDEFLL